MGKESFNRLKRAMIFLLDTLMSRIEKNESSRVAIIKLNNIGDFILWISYAEEIVNHYGKKNVTLIANESWATLAKELNLFEKIVEVSPRKYLTSVRYHFSKTKEIQRTGYKIAINPVSSRFISLDDSIMKIIRAKNKYGIRGDFSNQKEIYQNFSNKWYTDLKKINAEEIHELEKHRYFNKFLGISSGDIKATNLLKYLKEAKKEEKISMFVGSSWAGKNWNIEKYAELCDFILANTNLDIFLIGGNSEKSKANFITKNHNNPRIQDLTTKHTLIELIEFISMSKILITNDSMAAHIGVSTKTETIVILGGGHYGRFFPYPPSLNIKNLNIVTKKMDCFGCNWNCIYPKDNDFTVRCISEINTTNVTSYLEQSLRKANNQKSLH